MKLLITGTANKRRIVLLLTCIIAMALGPISARSQELTAHEILCRALDAQGGINNLEKLKSYVAFGKADVLGGYRGTYQSWAESPDKLKTKWDILIISHEQAYDGENGWEKLATVRQLTGIDLLREKREAVFDALVRYANDNVPVGFMGKKMISSAPGLSYSPQIEIQSQDNEKNEMNYTPLEGNPKQGGDHTTETYELRFSPPGRTPEDFYFDSKSFLLISVVRREPYMEGSMPVTTNYSDYRKVGGIVLPFSITELVPDLPVSITIEKYDLNTPIAHSVFENPTAAFANKPFDLALSTIPEHVYKEDDDPWSAGWQRFWGIPFQPTESWFFNVIVNEKYGRQVTPVSATMDFYCGEPICDSVNYSREELAKTMKFPVNRFSPQPEIYDFRYTFSRPSPLEVNKIVYTLHAVTPAGQPVTQSLTIPLTQYQLKHKYIFPIKGNFIVLDGHEYYELDHAYEWSQHYAYDILGLGPDFEFYKQGAQGCEAYYGFGTEIIAPASGIVTYARDDVPDMMPTEEYLKLRDPQYAIGGNIVLIDHGDGEVSLFAHSHYQSVRVKTGDHVRQGQVIATMGCSGAPGITHLHYQLQAGSGLFSSDGLPVRFENLKLVHWINEGESVAVPKRGVYLEAK